MSDNNHTAQTFEKMPELLAPAGDFQAFLGAINAGADAVYLAGDMFGARAYAKNLSKEEILEALMYAHVHGKKIYLTVNTLTKNDELKLLSNFLESFYLSGLDGVIVQDFGVFSFIHEKFPDLPIHVSTQMCVTSYLGAKEMQRLGAKRIVPARELSLAEIKQINALGIETECFIHGSMCYCYSGQCLFSSFLGNRSGNRGRCAGPCRQPYKLEKERNEQYLLSLKDLCTLNILPKLIEAGITSFKIEGRMKSAAYAAGVSAIYRKYIDLYLGLTDKSAYKVDPKDLEQLKSLYLRTDLQQGYYEKSKIKEMVSIKSPSYNKTDDALCAELTDRYCRNKVPVVVPVNAFFENGKEAKLVLCKDKSGVSENITITGDIVQKAQNAPLKREDLIKRLRKSSNGYYSFEIKELILSEDAFLPVGAINALRRNAEEKLSDELLDSCSVRRIVENCEGAFRNIIDLDEPVYEPCESEENEVNENDINENEIKESEINTLISFVTTFDQLEAICECTNQTDEICIPVSFFSDSLIKHTEQILKSNSGLYFFVELPTIIRSANLVKLKEDFANSMRFENVKGYYVSQPDSLCFVKEMLEEYQSSDMEIRGDLAFYIANNTASGLFQGNFTAFTISTELNKAEIKNMKPSCSELMIYGRIPLMQTANCVLNTTGNCRKNEGFTCVSDRLGVRFPIITHCNEKVCYNTIYNSVPISLHKHLKDIMNYGLNGLQLRFTNETADDVKVVYHIFEMGKSGVFPENVPYEYTNGHFIKGVL